MRKFPERTRHDVGGDRSDHLAKRSYDPAWGARPLRRVIQKDVQDPMAGLILEGAIKDGDAVSVTFDGNDFLFNGKSDKKAA